MRSGTVAEEAARLRKVFDDLASMGWYYVGNWRFIRKGLLYDLSAADLGQLDRIEREGLFVVSE